MKTRNRLAALLLLSSPFVLLASPETDRRIETAAKESYNFRTVLEDKVDVRARDGVVTLSGKVADRDHKALAEETVSGLPGVTSVRNDIAVAPPYPEKSDAWIALKIRSRLLVKANVSMAHTKVDVHDGVVTLRGTADNAAQKELTEVYAREIEGVRSVRNEITIEPPAPGSTLGEKIDDASITTQVKFALLHHKSTSALKTKVKTDDGTVIISGEAHSDAEKSLVTKLAQDVRGVKSVENRMTVK